MTIECVLDGTRMVPDTGMFLWDTARALMSKTEYLESKTDLTAERLTASELLALPERIREKYLAAVSESLVDEYRTNRELLSFSANDLYQYPSTAKG